MPISNTAKNSKGKVTIFMIEEWVTLIYIFFFSSDTASGSTNLLVLNVLLYDLFIFDDDA